MRWGKVVTCLQWPCNLGGKYIHPETWLLSTERLNAFLEEARCYLSCANKIIHYESFFFPGCTTAPLCSQGESHAPGFEDVSVAFLRSSFAPESCFKCVLICACVKRAFPGVLQQGLSHRGPWTEEQMKTILATNIKREQEISENVKVWLSNLLTVKCSCKNNCASFWKKELMQLGLPVLKAEQNWEQISKSVILTQTVTLKLLAVCGKQ